tara:strand:+ start:6967 stop:7602 length:636 start_codon:yes stop_codon:yes gene_type:complete
MKGRWITYSEAELAWLEQRREMTRRALHTHFCRAFGRTDVTLDNIKALCKRNGWLTGRSGHFQKGAPPANKGKKMPFHPNCARTQFKKGQEPHNTKHLGHERLRTDGYVEISVAETNPHTGYPRRYVQKHRWLWEKLHGPVPEGHCLKSLDGNKANTDPANWECIPRGLLPRLSGRHTRAYDPAPAALKPLIMATAKLEHKARQARKRVAG